MRIEGCTGYLQLDSGKNIKEHKNYYIMSNMWVDGEYFQRVWLSYEPDSTLLFKFNTEFTHVWYNGSTEKLLPAILDKSHECYYKNNGTFEKGQ